MRGSLEQLGINLAAMIVAGVATLYLQQFVWSKVRWDKRSRYWNRRSRDAEHAQAEHEPGR